MRRCLAQIQGMKTVATLSALVVASLSSLLLAGCAATSHPTTRSVLGTPRSTTSLEAVVDQPGPVTVETVISARWQVDRSGLVDLDDPRAKAAHLTDGPEPIDLFIHVIRHPQKGVFLVDSGVEHAFISDPSHALVHGMFGNIAHLERMVVERDMAALLAGEQAPVQAVLLTHLHLDHVLGLRDVPSSVPVFVGAGDPEDTSFMNLFQKGVYDAALEGKGPLREVRFAPDPDGTFAGVADVLGDGSLWAISVPGHTPGSMAFVARTPRGPVLLTGDACHTAWGWQHGVGPGTFSDDVGASAESLARLERFAARHPGMEVRLGHQELVAATAAR
jgi:glyoxylase-like metal-dependent hydrolase (beta-lactamase superfamily II)